MRYAVCPLAPGCMWWEGLGHSRHVKHVSAPVKQFKTANGAQNYARKHANAYNNGLVVVDTAQESVWDASWCNIDDCGNWGGED